MLIAGSGQVVRDGAGSRPTPHKRTVLHEWVYEAFVCGEPAGNVENGRRVAQEADSLGCTHCNGTL